MNNFKFTTIFFILLFFSCVSTSDIRLLSDYDKNINFHDYKTYVICIDDLVLENSSNPKYDNNQIRKLIGEQVENHMKTLGYQNNVLKPELQAGFQNLIVEKEVNLTNCNLQEDYKYWKSCSINSVTYTEQTLVVYVSDLEKNQVIWQASINCDLNKPKTLLKGYITDLVNTLFNEFPKNL